MAKWEYIRGSWWIFVIPHIVFLTIGIVLLTAYSNGLRTPESSWFPMDEILFLGIVFIVFPPIATLFLIFRINKHNRKQDLIIKDGIELQGEILSVCETGLEVNDTPEIEMMLLIEFPDGTKQEIKHRCFVNLLDLSKLSPGISIPVCIDPIKTERLVVNTVI